MIPLDGEPVIINGPGGIGTERAWQGLANRDANLRKRIDDLFAVVSGVNVAQILPASDIQRTIADPGAVESVFAGVPFTGQFVQRRTITANFAFYLASGGSQNIGMGIYQSSTGIPAFGQPPAVGDALICTVILPQVPNLQTAQVGATGLANVPVGEQRFYYITFHGPVGSTIYCAAAWTRIVISEG